MNLTADLLAVESRMMQISGATPTPAVPTLSPAPPVAQAGPRAFGSLVANAYEALTRRIAQEARVDPALVRAVAQTESGFDPHATSAAGAAGLMQLMPATSNALGVADPYDPAQNVRGGAAYLHRLLERFHGNVQLAVAAYNAGPGAVERYGGIPPYAETRTYVDRVMAAYRARGGV
ncbi:MAG: hypothetical protein NVSMB19_12440 [Vulcanimicrobiaceae bacterium]